MSGKQTKTAAEKLVVPISGYIALIFAIIFFAGIIDQVVRQFEFMKWLYAFDFQKLTGAFGTIGDTKQYFSGKGGSGAKDGFLFALTLIPSVMLALGVVEIVEHFGGLKAAQKLLTPLLKPLMGLPGITGLALISSLQSTDAGGSMTRNLRDSGEITENEKTIFAMFQFSAGATITNFLSSGAAVTSIILASGTLPSIILISFGVMFVFKVFGANLMRVYVKRFGEEG